MKKGDVFPRDRGTLWFITEIEAYLGLKNKDIDEMSSIQLIEYINQITLMLVRK